jgi:excisionase family DNA binding protein
METEAKTMSPREAAVRLGVRMDTVYELLWSNKLPAVNIDGCWQIDAAAVDERAGRKGTRLAA